MMTLLKSEMLDLLTDHLLLFEADLATLKFTWTSRPLEQSLGYGVQGELSGKLVEAVMPGLFDQAFLASPVAQTKADVRVTKNDGTQTPPVLVLIVPRATTAGRVVVGMIPSVWLTRPEGVGAK